MAFYEDQNYTTYIDEVDANTTYLGKAPRGSSTSIGNWFIQKIVTSGTVTSITYPNGTDRMEHIWDNRLSYTYS